ncbi:hypothetical protein R7P80_01730 [Vibrio sp. 2092]|uniref:hypothetical protein n=1 Tax=Vibrio sp. 2092 TaxID=3074593 RepID=UPI001192F1E3|nr:hypothetical protein [Vibrio sp. 2092]MCA2471500.1 hypothetical protein [Vibrio alginolyticus]MDW2151519.1 hypothetical protein [Vibrio sp. 2092]TVN07136.1 hypothetical protein FPV63_07555 [Vibrio cholerae]
MSLNDLVNKITKLNTSITTELVSPREVIIKPDSNKESYIEVRDNLDANFEVKSYTIQVFLHTKNGYESRNYFEPCTKRKTSTAIDYINRYINYIADNNCWK